MNSDENVYIDYYLARVEWRTERSRFDGPSERKYAIVKHNAQGETIVLPQLMGRKQAEKIRRDLQMEQAQLHQQ